MSPKSPKSLLYYYTQLKVYHYLYNVIELIQRNSFWYCFCDKTLSCEKYSQKKKGSACSVCRKLTKKLTLLS